MGKRGKGGSIKRVRMTGANDKRETGISLFKPVLQWIQEQDFACLILCLNLFFSSLFIFIFSKKNSGVEDIKLDLRFEWFELKFTPSF